MKIVLRLIIIIFLGFVVFLGYFSFIGFETSRFNNQIIKKIKKNNQNLEVELKKIKIVLDPFKLKLNAKTLGSKFANNGKVIELESLKSQFPISSLFNKNFVIENLEVSTKTLEITNLLSLIRSINNKPEIYLLEKIIKKGFLVADIELNFDKLGNLKKNIKINGLIKDLKIDLLNKYKIDKTNLIFNYEFNNLNLKDIDFRLNDIKFDSNEIKLKKTQNNFEIEGKFRNDFFELNKNHIKLMIQPLFPNIKIEKVRLNSKSTFNLNLNKRYKIEKFKIFSDINLDELIVTNHLEFKRFFPKIKKKISFLKNKISIDYSNENLKINGKGKIFLQNNLDNINYLIQKENKKYKFKTTLEIQKNPFEIKLLDYEKDNKKKLLLNIEGYIKENNKTLFDLISIEESKNKFEIRKLLFNEKFQIIDFEKAKIFYLDKKNNQNELNILKGKKDFLLSGKSFNADKIISNLIKNDVDEKKFINKDFNLKVKIDKLFLNQDYSLKNFEGGLSFKNQKIINGNLVGFFSNNQKLKFTVKTNNDEKITTLFLDRAKPIVSRYSFIKGFDEGVLDFYSSKKNKISNSTLKIYDFKLKELPALTKLLTLASLQGIADLLSGEGIRFDEFEMNFKNEGTLMTIDEIFAIGPAISFLMNGYIERKKIVSLRGTLVPATTINKVIGSIPILGQILVGSKTGEGVFGVSFKIKGPPNNLETTVNPIKTLTPRFITRTLEKIKKLN